jgi:ADP-L-glycero-D-manno-heptose 6-epimerase
MIVVTGAAGFIGSNLVAALNELGENDLLLVDRLGTDDKWRNIAKRQFQDIVLPDRAMAYLNNMKRPVTAVFHIGANSSTTAYDADAIVQTNLKSSMDYWNFCSEKHIPFFYASSAATYGDGAEGFDDESDPQMLKPLNLYGWSKHAFDLWALRQSAAGHVPPRWAGFKFFNVYGPNEYHKGDMMSLVAKNFGKVARGDAVKLFKSLRSDFADGQQLRDFVYVRDCCDVLTWFFHAPRHNGIYNLGSGQSRSFIDLVNAIGLACHKKPAIEFIPLPDALADKYQYFTEAKMDKLRVAGYDKTLTSLEDGVSDYVTHYLSQSDRYR